MNPRKAHHVKSGAKTALSQATFVVTHRERVMSKDEQKPNDPLRALVEGVSAGLRGVTYDNPEATPSEFAYAALAYDAAPSRAADNDELDPATEGLKESTLSQLSDAINSAQQRGDTDRAAELDAIYKALIGAKDPEKIANAIAAAQGSLSSGAEKAQPKTSAEDERFNKLWASEYDKAREEFFSSPRSDQDKKELAELERKLDEARKANDPLRVLYAQRALSNFMDDRDIHMDPSLRAGTEERIERYEQYKNENNHDPAALSTQNSPISSIEEDMGMLQQLKDVAGKNSGGLQVAHADAPPDAPPSDTPNQPSPKRRIGA